MKEKIEKWVGECSMIKRGEIYWGMERNLKRKEERKISKVKEIKRNEEDEMEGMIL